MKRSPLIVISTLMVSLLLMSCGSNLPKNPTVTGNISNLEKGSEIYLDQIMLKQIIPRDTAIIQSDGSYAFTYNVDQLSYYRLRINDQNFINLVLDVNEKPIISGDGNNMMDTYQVEGSPESVRLQQFNRVYKRNYIIQDSLYKIYQSNPNDQQVFINLQQAQYRSTNDMHRAFISLINENPASLVSLAIVKEMDPKNYKDLYKKIDGASFEKFKDNPWFVDFHAKVEGMVDLNIGDLAPDFILNNTKGNSVSLSSMRGKIVLIDFWASWCRPCRAENPNVVKAYQKYHTKGFDVLSVSLDGMPRQQTAKQDWLAAIQQDGLVWDNHVSDLKGWESSVVPLYGIQGIPFTLLVDKEGKIIGKNLRGAALEEKLASVIQ